MVITLLGILGLCFGSFINAAVWRMHAQTQVKSKKLKVKSSRDLSIVHGRSMCPNCQHILAWYDLLPVVSWLTLGGKCRYCKKPISLQYPLVELLTAGLFLLSYIHFPIFHIPYSIFLFVLWLVCIVGFVALMVYDLRWMLLPNRIVYPLQALAAFYAVLAILILETGFQGLIATVFSVLCSAGLFYVIFQISQGRWIGGGDVKLAVVLGLLLADPAKALLMLFIASLLGTIISVPLLASGKFTRRSRLPFGPLLILATIIVYLFGARLIGWYQQHLLVV